MKLTKDTVAALALPAGKADHIEWDDMLPGFGVRLRGNGKSWVVPISGTAPNSDARAWETSVRSLWRMPARSPASASPRLNWVSIPPQNGSEPTPPH